MLNSLESKGESSTFDQQPPKDYKPIFLNDFKDISKTDSTPNLVISSIDANTSDKVKVKFHLTQGRYFLTGAEASQYLSLFCGLKLDGFQEIKNFKVRQVASKEVQDLAIAIVMDLSGSMGEQRATVMQEAVKKIIQNKRPNDLITLVSYDSHVEVDCKPTADKNQLLNAHKVTGLSGFGGLTATLDGINVAVEE